MSASRHRRWCGKPDSGPAGTNAGSDGRADRRREQQRHPLGLALVPNGDQVVGILKDLLLGRATCGRFPRGSLPAPVLHFALVDAHGSGNMDQRNGRIEVGPKQMSRLVRFA